MRPVNRDPPGVYGAGRSGLVGAPAPPEAVQDDDASPDGLLDARGGESKGDVDSRGGTR